MGRVIARPYVGKKKGEFKRTSNRHDYALKPFGPTALNAMKDAGLDVISIGKINDIFVGEGITEAYKSKSSVHGMEQTIDVAKKDFHGLCFVNLVDFDALWGHRRNPSGYAQEIEKFDVNLGVLLDTLREDDPSHYHRRPWKRSDLYRNRPHQRKSTVPGILQSNERQRRTPGDRYLCHHCSYYSR